MSTILESLVFDMEHSITFKIFHRSYVLFYRRAPHLVNL
jgi:hypothetical protein